MELIVELVRVTQSHSCYYWFYDRNFVYWLISDIGLYALLGGDEVSGDVIVGGQYQTCCW
jgi:hypothetical protein